MHYNYNLKYVNLLIKYRYCYNKKYDENCLCDTDSHIVVVADFDLANIGFPDSL